MACLHIAIGINGVPCGHQLPQHVSIPPHSLMQPHSLHSLHLRSRHKAATPCYAAASITCMAAAQQDLGQTSSVVSESEVQQEPMVDFSFVRSSARLTKAAQMTWPQVVQPGDTVVDATCGNGHDTLALAQLVGPTGTVYAFDVQQAAIAATRDRLTTQLAAGQAPKLHILQQCHSQMQQVVGSCAASCIVFNLGYCPGGDKQLTTQVSSTLAAIEAALEVIKPGGMISIMLYHAHDEGQRETPAVRALAAELNPAYWAQLYVSCALDDGGIAARLRGLVADADNL